MLIASHLLFDKTCTNLFVSAFCRAISALKYIKRFVANEKYEKCFLSVNDRVKNVGAFKENQESGILLSNFVSIVSEKCFCFSHAPRVSIKIEDASEGFSSNRVSLRLHSYSYETAIGTQSYF